MPRFQHFPNLAAADPVAGYRAWYKADALVGYSEGDHITSWPDLSANGLDLAVSATSSRRPIYRALALNGLPGVEFTAGDLQFIEYSLAGSYLAAGGSTLFFVIKALAAPAEYPTNYQHILDTATNAANSRHYILSYTASGQAKVEVGVGSGGVSRVNFTADENLLVAVKFDGSSSLLRLNADGGRQSTAALNVALVSGLPFRLGAQNDSSVAKCATMTLCELIVFNSALGSSDFAAEEARLMAKWFS